MQVTPSTPGESGGAEVPPCAAKPEMYLDELLDNAPVQSKVAKAVWADYRERLEQVRNACAGCPLFVDCLYRAVVQVDVSGYVGCTTPRERRRIRRMLGISVRQGAHHMAQTLTTTTLPRNWAKVASAPSRVLNT